MRMILPEHDNPALREIAREVPVADIGSKHIQKLIAEMKALLAKEEYGVALAASQVGEPIKLFIVSGRALARDSRNAPDSHRASTRDSESQSFRAPDEPDMSLLEAGSSKLAALPDQVYINPEMTKMSRTRKEKHEGCLSIRGKWGTVARAEKATIRAYDEHGHHFTRGASGFLAHVFQHEMDHLEGILYIDKAEHIYDEKTK